MKEATWSVCTHRAPEDPGFATSWNNPMLLFLAQCRIGASGSVFAGKHCHHNTPIKWHGVPLVASWVCGSCLAIGLPFFVQAGEAPEDIPPRHPTAASHLHIPPGHPS